MNGSFDPKAINLLELLQKNNYKAYIVGGAVRDCVMGREITDTDIATDATPDEITGVFREYKVVDTGGKYGTITVIDGKDELQITTFRTDGLYKDFRRPESVEFSDSLGEDLSRRDFTMNAMAYNPGEGLIDLFNGGKDIENKLIRCVGDANVRFGEDALRILRALRFASVLGFEVEEQTEKAIFKRKELLRSVSAERINSELTKLLMGSAAAGVIVKYSEIIGVVIPHINKMKGFNQNNPHHIHDVLTHTAEVVKNSPKDKIVRWAALFHDMGKPFTYSEDERGCGHFYGHGLQSVILADEVMQRLRFDKITRESVLLLIKYHDSPIQPDEKNVKHWLARLGSKLFENLFALKIADNLAQNIKEYSRLEEYGLIKGIYEKIIAEEQCFSLKQLKINGDDVIALGVKPGKAIGEILTELFGEVIGDKLPNEKKALMQRAREIIKRKTRA